MAARTSSRLPPTRISPLSNHLASRRSTRFERIHSPSSPGTPSNPFAMISGTTSKPLNYNDYNVGWVCALPKEQTAAIAMLDQKHAPLPKPSNDHNTYTLGSVGNHNVVIACLPFGMVGNSSSATVATRMISTFPSIKFGLMVGIGGGIPPKVRLGDVVVSTPIDQFPGVVQWDLGKAEECGKLKRTGALNNPPSALLTALALLKTEHEMNGPKIPQYLDDLKKNWPRLVPKYTRTASLEDVLFRPDYGHVSESSAYRGTIPENEDQEDEGKSCRFCDRTKIIKRKSRDMLVHYGLIASGNRVIKDAVFRGQLNKDLGGNVLCVEMEAAGLMNDFPCIVIRGICDYADSHKNEDWQEHAAAVAAAFAKELLEYVQPRELDGERPAKEILTQVHDNVSKMKSQLEKDEDNAILNWLTPIDYGPQHSDYIKKRQLGTGQWLLDSVEYQAWLKTDKQTLFCQGIPGAGKTMLTSIVIDDLNTKFENDRNVGITYLYCNFRRQNEQKAEDLLASLLRQLSWGLSSLPDGLRKLYNHHNNKGTRTQPSFDQISRALQSVVAIYPRVFIVVDALDECKVSDGCRTRFLSEIFSLQAKTGANLFVTSRLIPEIREEFDGSPSLEIHARDEDVERWVDGHMWQLPSFVTCYPDLQQEIKTEIVKSVDGMFLLAQLHFNSLLRKRSPKAIRTALKRLATGCEAYDHAYTGAMERIEGQVADAGELAKQVLSWITCAKRPLTTTELRHALAVEIGESEVDEENLPQIEDMVSVCAGLVTVDEESNIIRLVHYTTQEYLERTKEDWFPKAQEAIARTCITYLSFRKFEAGICATDHGFKERLQQNPLYDYAARNWGHHAFAASIEGKEFILKFLASEAKVSSSSQALMASSSYHSQSIPRQVRGVHLAAIFGLKDIMIALLENGDDPDSKDTSFRTPLSYAAEFGHETVVKLLIEKGAGLESQDDSGRTPLLWAAGNGHDAVVELLIEEGVDLESRDNYSGRTPLLWAAGNGHDAVAELLIRKVADLESQDCNGLTPLLRAAGNGHDAVVELLIEEGADLESQDSNGRTPLSWAAGKGHEVVVELLIRKVADLESQDCNGLTPLLRAAGNGQDAVVKLLLEKGADLESGDNNGRTSLLWAAGNGHKAVVKLLIEKGAELESQDNYSGRTPLLWAARKGHEAVVKLLLEKGADLESQDRNGRTPLSWAAGNGHDAVVELLIEGGADLESQDNIGRLPLLWAAENGHYAVVKLLIEKGAGLESQDDSGRTPLLWAAGNGHKAVVKLLIEKGAGLESQDDSGRTPLLWAAENGHYAVVKLLIEGGADLEFQDSNGRPPLAWAAGNGRKKLVELLIEKGADLESGDNNGRTSLLWAAGNGHDAVVKLLIEGGADLEPQDSNGRTPLSWAAGNGRKKLVELLIEGGADLESQDSNGRTPLSWAAGNGHGAVVKLLEP
ncbi:ankyrin repeat [Fusarium beomiforme]|uniref:Ankyrin repeat n=1 Tax=Fusarium beomiforme TaxID=44412 RepID=A0A9P5AF52_9HYPO|nr:ankyrin repeat [Fusarium beomiforme]